MPTMGPISKLKARLVNIAFPSARLRGIVQAIPVPTPVQEFTRRYLSRFTAGFWGWSAATGFLLFIGVAIVARIFLAGGNLSAHAIETGQRVLIHVESGEVEGNARHTQAVEPAVSATTPDTTTPVTSPTGTETPTTPPTTASNEGLAPAPFAAISLQTDKGIVPITAKDGTLPWKYYARPYKVTGRPMVAIAITHLGLNKPLTEDTLTLPHGFTLSFSPYASDARKWASTARDAGFETMVDLPMQSTDYIRTGADPGPHGLLDSLNTDETNTRLTWVLSRFPGFVGMLAPDDENLTSNLPFITPAMIQVTGHGVLFIYRKTPKNAALADAIKTHKFYALGIDAVIDEDIAPGPIDKQLDSLTELAKSQGYAIGFAHSYPPTVDALKRWAAELDAKGVDLVPVSAIGMKAFP